MGLGWAALHGALAGRPLAYLPLSSSLNSPRPEPCSSGQPRTETRRVGTRWAAGSWEPQTVLGLLQLSLQDSSWIERIAAQKRLQKVPS